MSKGLLIVFSGPSGVGKDTVLKELLKKNDNLKLSISATTRKKRTGEIDGQDYYFLKEHEFLILASNDKMLEYAKYCSNYYGTPREPIERWLNEGFDVILEIEVQGGLQVLEKRPDSVGIFILPPSFQELEQRLRTRGTDLDEVILNRLKRAKLEIAETCRYDYAVINEKVDVCAENVNMIIRSEKMKYKNMKKVIEGVLLNGK